MITISTDKPIITQGDEIKITVYVKEQDGEPKDLSKACREFSGDTSTGSFISGERVRQAVTGYLGYFIEEVEGSIYLRDISGTPSATEDLTGLTSLASYTPTAQTVPFATQVFLDAYSDFAQELIIETEELTAVNASRGIFETSLMDTSEWPLGLYILRALIVQPMGAEAQSENSRQDHLVVKS